MTCTLYCLLHLPPTLVWWTGRLPAPPTVNSSMVDWQAQDAISAPTRIVIPSNSLTTWGQNILHLKVNINNLWIDYICGCIQTQWTWTCHWLTSASSSGWITTWHCGDMTRMALDMYTILPAPPTINSSLVDWQAQDLHGTRHVHYTASSTYHQL